MDNLAPKCNGRPVPAYQPVPSTRPCIGDVRHVEPDGVLSRDMRAGEVEIYTRDGWRNLAEELSRTFIVSHGQ